MTATHQRFANYGLSGLMRRTTRGEKKAARGHYGKRKA